MIITIKPNEVLVVRGARTKSDEIRERSDAGESRSAIAKAMGISYQQVRQALVNRPKPRL